MSVSLAVRRLLAAVCLSSIAIAVPSAAATTASWNGWRWSRTGPLEIKVENRLSAAWQPYLQPALTNWSAAPMIDMVATPGTPDAGACSPTFGIVAICNGNYGANGWLGYAYVWLSAGRIVQANVRMNDYYFATAKYNVDSWKQQTICQELGHTIGLAHNNTTRTDVNTGTCMDYTNNPLGGGTNGTLTNLTPGQMDFDGLNVIYANVDATQLAQTKPTLLAGDGLSIGDQDHDVLVNLAVPEPSSWAMLIAGFGLTGATLRRRRAIPVVVA